MQTDWEQLPDGGTVLVVDDEILVRVVVARTLQQAGYRVREAASAAAALTLLASSPSKPDLILSDVRMPGMNGVDFAVEMRRSWAQLPVVLMSAYEPPNLHLAHAAGFLAKPFSPEGLLRVVDVAMKQAAVTARHRLSQRGGSALPLGIGAGVATPAEAAS